MEERIKGLLSREPSEEIVKAEGWVRTKRDSKNVCFLEINDGSCLKGLQAVIDKAAFNNNNLLDSIATGASVIAKGKIVKSQGGDQAVELLVEDLELVAFCDLIIERKGALGTPFHWTYASKHKGKSIQLKAPLI